MCEPVTATLAVVKAGLSAYQSFAEAKDQKRQAEYEADVARQNAALAYEEAGRTQRMGEENRRDLAVRVLQEQGEAKAQYAASGLLMNGGSFRDYMNDIASSYDTDARRLDYDTQQRARSYLTNAFNYSAQSQAARARAKSAVPWLSALSAGLQGAASGVSAGNALNDAWDRSKNS